MSGPPPLDPASLQAASASVGNILPGGGGPQIAVDPGALGSLSSTMSSEANRIQSMASATPLASSGNPELDGAMSGYDQQLRNVVGTLGQVVGAVSGLVSEAATSYTANDNSVGQSMHGAG